MLGKNKSSLLAESGNLSWFSVKGMKMHQRWFRTRIKDAIAGLRYTASEDLSSRLISSIDVEMLQQGKKGDI
jgi:hypothetical protein